jgi:hypothetical protein
MSFKIRAATAAKLVDLHETIVRGWIVSEAIPATKNTETGKYEIDTDDLLALATRLALSPAVQRRIQAYVARITMGNVAALAGPDDGQESDVDGTEEE